MLRYLRNKAFPADLVAQSGCELRDEPRDGHALVGVLAVRHRLDELQHKVLKVVRLGNMMITSVFSATGK
jgi:hypothetical protein